ncbi:MAG: ribonuclease R [Clostridia bacterium]|nr:ribonuclease R [Clostridia bacterium]
MKKEYENKSSIFNRKSKEYLDKKEALTSFFLNKEYVPMTQKHIANLLNVPKEERDMLNHILEELELEAIVCVDDSKRYIPFERTNLVKGVYQAKSEKFGFVLLENSDDIYIPANLNLHSMNGDLVIAAITKQNSGTKSKEGKIVKILKRNTTKVVGRFMKSKNFGFVEAIDKKIGDIYIPKKYAANVKNGQIVEIELLKYATESSKAEGRILSIVSSGNTVKSEIEALYKSFGLDKLEVFNDAVQHELNGIPDTVSTQDKIGREDRTNRRVYTIDGDDAKDLDDGVFVEKINDNKYILSVYIADVSHYVKDASALDEEALTRGTSVYIPGTVLPMLPRKLSNGICSLNENVERLSLAIDLQIDGKGNVTDSNIFKTVIKVTKRMTYDKVFKVIENTDEEVNNEYKPYIADILVMKELAILLNNKRREIGSINFDIPDTKVVLDDKGNVIGIEPYNKTIANDIIEEFMLAANMAVAKTFFFLELPFIYRIHEKPDEEKLRDLNEILGNYKKRVTGLSNVQPKVLAKILDEFDSEEEKRVVSTFMLRTLKLAKYSSECDGHFGLAAKYYCHFTSPIRRYPDLFIHRVISEYLASNYMLSEESIQKYTIQANKYAISSSEAEKQATTIERDFDDLYKVIYMQDYINESFTAVISSITSFGMFVKLENTVEGLIPFNNMPDDDYYEFDETKRILVGKRKGRVFKIGEHLTVKLVKCDVKLKEIDFMLE